MFSSAFFLGIFACLFFNNPSGKTPRWKRLGESFWAFFPFEFFPPFISHQSIRCSTRGFSLSGVPVFLWVSVFLTIKKKSGGCQLLGCCGKQLQSVMTVYIFFQVPPRFLVKHKSVAHRIIALPLPPPVSRDCLHSFVHIAPGAEAAQENFLVITRNIERQPDTGRACAALAPDVAQCSIFPFATGTRMSHYQPQFIIIMADTCGSIGNGHAPFACTQGTIGAKASKVCLDNAGGVCTEEYCCGMIEKRRRLLLHCVHRSSQPAPPPLTARGALPPFASHHPSLNGHAHRCVRVV